MKRFLVISLSLVLLLVVAKTGCSPQEPAPPEVPALNGGQEAKMVELTMDDFTAQNHITRDIELIRPGSLIVTLGANPTTGFQWTEDAANTAPEVVAQVSYTFVEPQTDVVGAPEKDVWVFDSLAPGTATVSMSYDRPWEGGEKGEWTLTLNITVQ